MLSAWGCLSMRGNQKHTISFPLGGNVASTAGAAAGERLKCALAEEHWRCWDTRGLPLVRFGVFQHNCFPHQAKQPWHLEVKELFAPGLSIEHFRDCRHLGPWKGSPCSHCVNTSQAWDAGQVSVGPSWILHLAENKPAIAVGIIQCSRSVQCRGIWTSPLP